MGNIASFGKAISVLGTGIGFPGTAARLGERVVKARVNSNATLNINFGDPCLLIPDSTGGTWRSVADYLAGGLANIGNVLAYWAGIAFREVQTMYTYPENVVPGTADPVGFYPPGVATEVMERGSITVKIAAGTPQANMPVYLRLVANALVAGSAVGDLEAAADVALSTTATASVASTSLTVASYTGIAAGQAVSGPGIPAGAYVTTTPGSSTVTISAPTTMAIGAGTPVTFGNTIKLPNVRFSTGVLDANNIAEITLIQREAA
jgi:hypothetical protein